MVPALDDSPSATTCSEDCRRIAGAAVAEAGDHLAQEVGPEAIVQGQIIPISSSARSIGAFKNRRNFKRKNPDIAPGDPISILTLTHPPVTPERSHEEVCIHHRE